MVEQALFHCKAKKIFNEVFIAHPLSDRECVMEFFIIFFEKFVSILQILRNFLKSLTYYYYYLCDSGDLAKMSAQQKLSFQQIFVKVIYKNFMHRPE